MPAHPHDNAPADSAQRLVFIRHGATELNLAGLRCGGDLDVPLSAIGRAQAAAAALCLANLAPAVGVIVTSHLRRAQESAEIIAADLNLPIVIEPLFAERRLGEWNGHAIAATQAWLDEGRTPPGGESRAELTARVQAGLRQMKHLWSQRPLLVSSQGVARVLGQLAGAPAAVRVANAQWLEFVLPAQAWNDEKDFAMEAI